MIGQDAVTTAEAFREGVGFTGVVLTKLDGDARGGAALSVREVTGVPILFASTGEKLEDFDVFHPDRMASRILGMGDVLSLIEQAEQVFDAEQAEAAAAKIGSGELTLEDFLEQMLAIRKMGPIGNLLGMLPGAGQMKDALAEVDDRQLDRLQAIIRGMTPQERADPKIINASRRLRIANGSGVTVSEVNQLVDRFFEARKMMSSMLGGMGIPGLGRKSATRKAKGAKGQEGQEGGARPDAAEGRAVPFGAGMPGMPAGFPDLSQMPEGLNELPPGLADFDLSKLKFPGNRVRTSRAVRMHVRGRGLPGREAELELWIVDGRISTEPVCRRRHRVRRRLDSAGTGRRALPRRARRSRRDPARRGDRPGRDRTRCRRAAAAGLRLTHRHPQPRRARRPAPHHPGRKAPGPTQALLGGLLARARRRVAAAGRGGRGGASAATAGSSWSATGSTAASAISPRCGPTTCSRPRSTPRTPTAPGSPRTSSARTRCPG